MSFYQLAEFRSKVLRLTIRLDHEKAACVYSEAYNWST
jgi:hypothetical protein